MIKIDMEMPKYCDECPFFDDRYDYPTCIINNLSSGYNFPIRKKRMDFCPLQEERPTADWIWVVDEAYKCLGCGSINYIMGGKWNYCSNCGAKMRGSEEEE